MGCTGGTRALYGPRETGLKVCAYTRFSTPEQSTTLQLQELEDYIRRQGWEIAASYSDTISGTKARRPGLDLLMATPAAGSSMWS